MKTVTGDITSLEADVIVNAANGIGPMGGGVAAAIRRAGGREIEEEAIEVCRRTDPAEGEVYVTGAGKLKFRYVFHAVTMKQPAQPSSIEIVKTCLDSLLEKAREMEIASMVLPALATGVGGVPKEEVAKVYASILGKVIGIDITVADVSGEFIKKVEKYMYRQCN